MSDQQPDNNELNEEHAGYFRLLRDVLGFQLKLFLDGLRDILLSPISITAALVGAFTDPKNPGKHFYRLLDVGYESDRWINLFNKHTEDNVDRPSPDNFVRHAESIVLSEYKKNIGKPPVQDD